jgi:hydroxyethylthiazole kinase-like uncharacterized protein yjeF
VNEILSGSFSPLTVASPEARAWMLPSSSEMAELDAATIRRGVSALELMERAGVAMAEQIANLLRGERKRVLVLCGPGNNGGDGLVVARILSERTIPVTALMAPAERYSPECIEQMKRLGEVVVASPKPAALNAVGPHVRAVEADKIEALFSGATIVVDALLGTGQRSALRGPIATLAARAMAEKESRPSVSIVSLDIPTGVDGDTGCVATTHIVADLTISVELVKRGMLQFPARSACGRIATVGIGIASTGDVACTALEGAALPRLPKRGLDSHKGDLGRVLIIGGSRGMPGAPVLSVLGALRSGAGLVTKIGRESWFGASTPPECMLELLGGDAPCFIASDAPQVCDAASQADVVVVGPGMGQSPDTAEFLTILFRELKAIGRRAVVDADALNLISRQGTSLQGMQAVVTPHPGEASRLLGKPVALIQSDRFSAVHEISERYSAVTVLKGAGSIVYGEGRTGIVARGTPYLATAGSGDILAGIIAAMMARVSSLFEAAALGTYIHARAGEVASERSGGPVLASDVALGASSIVGTLER